jgi:hypothetical protein
MKNIFCHQKPRSDSSFVPSDTEPDGTLFPLQLDPPRREKIDVLLEPNQSNDIWEAAKNHYLSGPLSKSQRAMIQHSATVEDLISTIQRNCVTLVDSSIGQDLLQAPLSDRALLELQAQARKRSLSCKAITVVASCFCDRLDFIARATSSSGVIFYFTEANQKPIVGVGFIWGAFLMALTVSLAFDQANI